MKSLKISYDDFIEIVIIVLNDLFKRRMVTNIELDCIKNRIYSNALENNMDFCVAPIYDEDRFEEFIESTNVDDEIIYRLKPIYTIEDLRNNFIGLFPMDLINLLYNKKIYNDLDNNFTSIQKYGRYFQRLDEEYQLELMYQYLMLEKAQKELKDKIRTTMFNSSIYVDDIKFENIIEQNPDITCDKLIRAYQRKE